MENIQNLEGLKQALDIMRNGVLLITQENTSSTIKVNKQKKIIKKKNQDKSTILKFTGQFDENQMASSKKYQQLKNCQKTSIPATNQYSENNSNQKLENFNQKISNKMININQNDILSCNKKQKTTSQQEKQNQQKILIKEKPVQNQLQFPFANQEFQRYFNLTKEDIQNDNNIVLQVLRKCQILEITTQTNLNLNMHLKSKNGTQRSNNQKHEIYNQNLEQYILQYFQKIKKNYEILKQKTIDKNPEQKQHKHTKDNQNEQGQQITSVQNSLEQNKAKDFNENICENNQNNNINFNNDNSDSKLFLEDEQLLLNEQKNYNRIQRILVSFQDDGLDQEIIFEVKLDFYRSSFQNKETLILAFIDQSEYLNAHNNYLQNKQKDELLANVTHDLKTPIKGIIDYLQEINTLIDTFFKKNNNHDKEQISQDLNTSIESIEKYHSHNIPKASLISIEEHIKPLEQNAHKMKNTLTNLNMNNSYQLKNNNNNQNLLNQQQLFKKNHQQQQKQKQLTFKQNSYSNQNITQYFRMASSAEGAYKNQNSEIQQTSVKKIQKIEQKQFQSSHNIIDFENELSMNGDEADFKLILQQISDLSKNTQDATNMLFYLVRDIQDYSILKNGSLRLFPVQFDLNQLIFETVELQKQEFICRNLSFEFNHLCSVSPTNNQTLNNSLPSLQNMDNSAQSNRNMKENIKPFFINNDPLRLKQVLMNLVSNSLKYTRKGQITIQVDLQNLKLDKDLMNFESNNSNSNINDTVSLIEITVQDSGLGMDKETIKQLFTKYNPIDQNTNSYGVGLGLCLVQDLVNYLGPQQQVEVTSEPNQGSKFKFYIYANLEDTNFGGLEGGGNSCSNSALKPQIQHSDSKQQQRPRTNSPQFQNKILKKDSQSHNSIYPKSLKTENQSIGSTTQFLSSYQNVNPNNRLISGSYLPSTNYSTDNSIIQQLRHTTNIKSLNSLSQHNQNQNSFQSSYFLHKQITNQHLKEYSNKKPSTQGQITQQNINSQQQQQQQQQQQALIEYQNQKYTKQVIIFTPQRNQKQMTHLTQTAKSFSKLQQILDENDENSQNTSNQQNKLNILIVDDNASILQALRLRLKSQLNEVNIFSALSGQEALQIVENTEQQYQQQQNKRQNRSRSRNNQQYSYLNIESKNNISSDVPQNVSEIPSSKLITNTNTSYSRIGSQHKSIDIIITDMNMPVMDGLQLAQKVKNINKNIVIYLSSAYEYEYDPKKYPHLDGILSKPPTTQQLKNVLFKQIMSSQNQINLSGQTSQQQQTQINNKRAKTNIFKAGLPQIINYNQGKSMNCIPQQNRILDEIQLNDQKINQNEEGIIYEESSRL